MRYVRGLIESNAMLERMVSRQTEESIELSNRAVIEVGTASFRTARGYTFAAVIADEIAFWRSDDSANPDHEIVSAVRPGLATLGGPLIALSSPYAKRGALWDQYRRHYGADGAVVVAQAPSRTMNPKLPERIVTEALERDPDAARAEYLAEFRSDLEAFIDRETVDATRRKAPMDLPPENKRYMAFVDPAGGGRDEFCLAIGHVEGGARSEKRERGFVKTPQGIFGNARSRREQQPTEESSGPPRVVIDVIRGRTGTPADIVAEYVDLLREYGIREVTGDRYAGAWPADEFDRHGIRYRFAGKPKSDLYVDALPAFLSQRVEIPPDDRLVTQLASLERRTSRAGRDSIDHRPGAHDDRANAAAGLIATAPTLNSRGVQSKPIKGLV